jgi:hypothetical protein
MRDITPTTNMGSPITRKLWLHFIGMTGWDLSVYAPEKTIKVIIDVMLLAFDDKFDHLTDTHL